MPKLLIVQDDGSVFEASLTRSALPCSGTLFFLNFLINKIMLANFDSAETNGSGVIKLQGSPDGGTTWLDISDPLTMINGAINVNDTTGVSLDPAIWIPGQQYQFRLIDVNTNLASTVRLYTIPTSEYGYGYGSGGGAGEGSLDTVEFLGVSQTTDGTTSCIVSFSATAANACNLMIKCLDVDAPARPVVGLGNSYNGTQTGIITGMDYESTDNYQLQLVSDDGTILATSNILTAS